MMIEKVMIQSGAKSLKNSGGGWGGTGDAEDAGSQLEKHPKSQKAKKPPAAAELAMQRMRKERNCECR